MQKKIKMKKTITLIFGICFALLTYYGNAQTQADSAYVTFQVDMSGVSTSFTTPEVNGTFNSWWGLVGQCQILTEITFGKLRVEY